MTTDRLTVSAILESVKVDRDGEWSVVLTVPVIDGPKAAALALQTQKVFYVDFRSAETEETETPA